MKVIPEKILKIINNKSLKGEKLILREKKFILIKDKMHSKDTEHYCAWFTIDKPSLLSLDKADVLMLENVKKIVLKKLNFTDDTHKVFIHFPPTWWSLHIHFVSNNYFNNPNNDISKHLHNRQVFFVNDIIKNLKNNSNYYRERIFINV